MQKELETFLKTHADTDKVLAKDLKVTLEELSMKTREYDAIKAKVGKLKKGMATLCDAPNANEAKIY